MTLTIARLELEIQQQITNIKASQYRKLQLGSEADQIDKNITSANEAVADLQKQLAAAKEQVKTNG